MNFRMMRNHLTCLKNYIDISFFWKYFLLSLLIFLFIAFIINRYTPKVFSTTAKIQILDKKQSNLEMPSAEDLFSSSKTIRNEIEVIKSSSILREVIKNLNLNFYVESVEDVMTARDLNYPFKIEYKFTSDSTSNFSFNIQIDDDNLEIINLENKTYLFNDLNTKGVNHNLPFDISNIKKENWNSNSIM